MPGPYAPPTATVGGLPTVGLDVPICAVMMALYLGAAAGHMALFQLNRRRNHFFLLSVLMFGFCMARMMTMVMRIVWACHLFNVKIAMAANIFVSAGVLILFIINVIFSQRILRAAHPYFGWHRAVTAAFNLSYILIVGVLAMTITAGVQSAYTLDPSIRQIDRKLQFAASSYMLFFSFLPIPVVAIARPRAAHYAGDEALDSLQEAPLVNTPGPSSRLAPQSAPSGARTSGLLQDVALDQSYGLVSKESAINEIDADVEHALGRFQDHAQPAQQDLDAPSSRTRRKTSRGLSREPSVDPEKEKSSRVAAWADSVESVPLGHISEEPGDVEDEDEDEEVGDDESLKDTEPSSFPSGIFDASYNFERGLRKPRYPAASPRPYRGQGTFERIQVASSSIAKAAHDRISDVVAATVDLSQRILHITNQINLLESRLGHKFDRQQSELEAQVESLKEHQIEMSTQIADLEVRHQQQHPSALATSDGVASPLLPRVNFFAPSNGAIVDPRRSSPTKAKAMSLMKRATLRALGITQTVSKGPMTALEPWQDVGDCWCAASRDQGDYIRLHVTTLDYIYPTDLVLEHFPPSGSLRPGTTPKDLELWASVADLSEEERARLRIAELQQDNEDINVLGPDFARLGSFTLPANQRGADLMLRAREFVLRVTSTYGADNACLYRVRLHGQRVEDGE
ncbi:hypothetical protein DV735_g1321, partial [Chaetothyriales sp. CBS 134920]